MANVSCSACEDLRQTDPNLIVNGFGDDECVSLQNNTGLVATSGHEDFEDLNNMNDCFVGNMATEIEAYDVCNWKDFMKKFIPKEKLGKKARKQLDTEQRSTWAFSPVTKKVESKKLYNRKRKAHDRYDDYGMGFSFA